MKHEEEKEDGNSLWIWSFIKSQPIWTLSSLNHCNIHYYFCRENLITATPKIAAPKQKGKEQKTPSTFITAATRQWPARQVQKQKSARFMGISLQSAGDLQSVTGRTRRSGTAGVSLLSQKVKRRQRQQKKWPLSPPVQYQINNTYLSFSIKFLFFEAGKKKTSFHL